MKRIIFISIVLLIIILPISVMAIEQGKNLFDGEMELGGISWGTGKNYFSTDCIRTKNYIKVKENTSYILTTDCENTGFGIVFYDKDKNYISLTSKVAVSSFTTPEGTRYIRFMHMINELIYSYQLEEGTEPTEMKPYYGIMYRNKIREIINELFGNIKNIAVAISKTITEFFYDGYSFTFRGYLFFAYVATVFCLSVLAIVFKRR